MVRIADHESDGHRFAERAAEAEHDAADHADTGVRPYDVSRDLACRAPETVGRLFEHGWYCFKYVTRDRRDEGQDHDCENEARGKNADAVRRTGEQSRQQRNVTEQIDQDWLNMLLQE